MYVCMYVYIYIYIELNGIQIMEITAVVVVKMGKIPRAGCGGTLLVIPGLFSYLGSLVQSPYPHPPVWRALAN